MSAFRFELLAHDGKRRRGRYWTPHGSFETPCFAPVGTYGALKGLTPRQVAETGTELILANSYHLHLRPGEKTVAALGGLHRFMGWDGPILTDSGGFQVFSLAQRREVDDGGVTFRSTLDGSPQRLTPEGALQIQRDLGADVVMVLDECPPGDGALDVVACAHERTLRWARVQRDVHESWGGAARGQALFGIVQGGTDLELRARSADALVALEFDGYAVGGLAVGETEQQRAAALAAAVPRLPAGKVRYLMGVGTPEDLEQAVAEGIDLFDCVTPTRHGRNHEAFTSAGKVKLRNAQWAQDPGPLDAKCACYTCRTFSLGYLRHLAVSDEMLCGILLSLHNITFFQTLMRGLRDAITGTANAAPGRGSG